LTIVNDATTTVSLLLTRLGAITGVMSDLVALVALKKDCVTEQNKQKQLIQSFGPFTLT
jgi:hypothetical protein